MRDADGIALGGIRTPPVDVPGRDALRRARPEPRTVICILLGSTKPFTARAPRRAATRRRTSTRRRYDEAADAAIEAGYVLEEDRKALLGFADPSKVKG